MKIAYITHTDCLKHDIPGHPEAPARLSAIEHAIQQANITSRLNRYMAPLITKEKLYTTHTKAYVDKLFDLAPKNGLTYLDPDTAMNPYTLIAAQRAAGALILATDLILTKKEQTAFCCVRPPGHHATRAKAMGFCLFNNIALGVIHALNKYHLKRVAILDFDVHNGNGTIDIFHDQPRVLYCSSFQSPFYPFVSSEANNDHIDNIPLPIGTDGNNYQRIMRSHLTRLKQFKPELIFISAGFDAHESDPLAQLQFTENDFYWITDAIREIAEEVCYGQIISTLEGGYNLTALANSVVAHLKALINCDPLT